VLKTGGSNQENGFRLKRANKGYNTQPGWLFDRGVKQVKEKKMPQSYCLNAYGKCDLEWE